MSSLVRFAVVVLAALLFVAPAAAVQPKGSAAWTTDGWAATPDTLYSGPGTRYNAVGSVAPGERIRVDRCTNRWCEIRTASARGWILIHNLSFGQKPEGPLAGPKFNTPRGGAGQVCFYSGPNFTGSVFCENSGRVIHDLARLGADNSIESIEIGKGVSVMVCRDRGFRSWCDTLSTSTGRLDGLLVNSISSLRVY